MSNTDDTSTGDVDPVVRDAGTAGTDNLTGDSPTGSAQAPEKAGEQPTMESMTQADPQGIEDPEGIEATMGDGIGG